MTCEVDLLFGNTTVNEVSVCRSYDWYVPQGRRVRCRDGESPKPVFRMTSTPERFEEINSTKDK